MTLKRMGRGAIASIVSAAMGLGLTACGRDYTVGYLYSTSGQDATGYVNGYKIDYQYGYLVQLANSPISSGGRYPITIVASPDHLSLYVINRDDASVLHFLIGTDGKIYPQKTYNITGSFATDASIDSTGKFLYVTYTYQIPDGQQSETYTTASPGPGGVTIFPINSDGSLGSASTVHLGRAPVKIAAGDPNHFVYVIAQDTETTANLFGFSQNTSTGALTQLPGITINAGNVVSTGYTSGVTPAGITVDSTGNHLYLTDKSANNLLTYTVASNGVPSLTSTTKTGGQPGGMTIDSSGKYLYVASYTDGAINGYTFDSNGIPVASSVSPSTQAGTGTTCVTTMNAPATGTPSHAVYLYASNQLSNNITGTQMSTSNGRLTQIQSSPYGANTLPTCLVAVPASGGR